MLFNFEDLHNEMVCLTIFRVERKYKKCMGTEVVKYFLMTINPKKQYFLNVCRLNVWVDVLR